MNANWYDAEQKINESRAFAQAMADDYALTPARPHHPLRAAYRNTLVLTGGALIALGRRLQGEIQDMTATPLELGQPRQMPTP